jgi:hypothetical protein
MQYRWIPTAPDCLTEVISYMLWLHAPLYRDRLYAMVHHAWCIEPGHSLLSHNRFCKQLIRKNISLKYPIELYNLEFCRLVVLRVIGRIPIWVVYSQTSAMRSNCILEDANGCLTQRGHGSQAITINTV